jgi:hypothetical protein
MSRWWFPVCYRHRRPHRPQPQRQSPEARGTALEYEAHSYKYQYQAGNHYSSHCSAPSL